MTAQMKVPGPKILLLGGTGSGKTHSIRTLINSGLKVAAIFTEPGMETIADLTCEKGLHWKYIAPAAPAWGDMLDSAKKINTLSFEGLTKLPDLNKSKYTEFLDLLTTCSNFKCDRCGESFGAVDDFGQDWAFVVDSLSGLNIMAMNLVAGSKPVKSMADWGVAMDNLERFITKFTTDIPCMAVMMAHLEREGDEVTGAQVNMASTLGKKLAPKIPRFFSDVIHARRDGTKFTWSTITMNTDLKARNIPLADNQEPSFAPIVKRWQEHNK